MGIIAVIPNLINHFIDFLVIVGSIFVPLIAIMVTDYFLVKKQKVDAEAILVEDQTSKYWYTNGFNWKAIVIWLVGIVMYNLLYFVWTPLGSTVPTFLVISFIYFLLCSKERTEA